MKQSRQGDATAIRTFCKRAKEILRIFSGIPYFVKCLGRDEIQGILSLTVMEFLMGYPKLPPDEEIPRLLKRITRNALLNQIHKESIRTKYRQPFPSSGEPGNDTGEETEIGQFLADSSGEPESKLLQQELNQSVRNAMNSLISSEYNVLYGMYFEQKSVSALAREMQCTRQNVWRLYKNGLRHLRKYLAQQMASPLLPELKEKLL